MPLHTSTLTLLCVEDNKTTQLLYEAALEDSLKEIIFADNGQEGYERYKEGGIDLIISDYEMPLLNGLEMIEMIRSEDKEIPIVLISAIDDVAIIIQALQLNVNNFVKKPIVTSEIQNAVDNAAKILQVDRYIKEQQDKELQALKTKEIYTEYQEKLALNKELNILRNDFYYQVAGEKNISLVDFLYQPLDMVSGDAYSARKIDENRTLYLIVDGMGKGLSASLTAMLMTAFINHIIDKMKEFDSFSLEILIKESMEYIKPILLDEEALAIDYILFDSYYNKLRYAKFAMPAFLLQDKNDQIIKIKSNNPPLSKWQPNYRVDEYDIGEIDKFLFFSDGIVENSTNTDENDAYSNWIEADFKSSFTREELKQRIFEKVDTPEDDFTLIFINKLDFKNKLVTKKSFQTSLTDVDSANEWYEALWSELCEDVQVKNSASVVFTELYMNAYEHGNLGINSAQKHAMLEDDTYFDTLYEKEKDCNKEIHVEIAKIQNLHSSYIVTKIIDEGEGFDTQILSEIFRNSETFNGRGVFVSRKNSMGIYYNAKGNEVYFLNKI